MIEAMKYSTARGQDDRKKIALLLLHQVPVAGPFVSSYVFNAWVSNADSGHLKVVVPLMDIVICGKNKCLTK